MTTLTRSDFCLTKNKIVFLSPDDLISLISRIEQHLPGYWYSLSLQKGNLRISVGPSKFCLLDVDRAWATTKEGDSGIICDIPLNATYSIIALTTIYIENVEKKVSEIRKEMLDSGVQFPGYVGKFRFQDRDARRSLRRRYTEFLNDLPEFEKGSFSLKEFYIGSCQLSVDVSLRGIVGSKTPVDISVDLLGDAKLVESLHMAVDQLRETIS